jgi:hypothetical protein
MPKKVVLALLRIKAEFSPLHKMKKIFNLHHTLI